MKMTSEKNIADENIENAEVKVSEPKNFRSFRVSSRRLGIKGGLSYDKISTLIEQIEELKELDTGKRKL